MRQIQSMLTDNDVKRLLDLNAKDHLRMMVELPRHAIEKAQWAQVKRRIETFNNHPGLLCWGSEERVARGETPNSRISSRFISLVHQLDPNHPLVLGDTRDIIQHLMVDRRDFFPDQAMDAGIWWWYPIPLDGADGEPLEGHEKGQRKSRAACVADDDIFEEAALDRDPVVSASEEGCAVSYAGGVSMHGLPEHHQQSARAVVLYRLRATRFLWQAGGSFEQTGGRTLGLCEETRAGIERAESGRSWRRVRAGSIVAPNPAMEFSVHELITSSTCLRRTNPQRRRRRRFHGQFARQKRASSALEQHAAKVEGDYLADTFAPFGVHVYCIQ